MSLGKQLHRLNVWETIEGSFKVGLPGINGVITPISRIISPTLPIDFRPFIRVISPWINNWARGLPCIATIFEPQLRSWVLQPLQHYPWPLPIWDSGSALLYLETRKNNQQ